MMKLIENNNNIHCKSTFCKLFSFIMINFYIFVSCGKQGAASLGCECAMPSCARAKPGIVRDHAVSRRNSPCPSPASGGFFPRRTVENMPIFLAIIFE